MRAHLYEKELPEALRRAAGLPSLPAVALEVLRISQDEEASLDDLASCLSRDPALAARLLKLANSPLFGGGKAVTTLQRATLLLGMKTVKLMALSFSLTGSVPASGRAGSFDYGRYWHRSLACALAARALAKLVDDPLADEAFLCGLFAHFGKLVLARCLPETYEPVVAACQGWPDVASEERLLGFSSTDVCATLLKQWGLPELIFATVGCSTRPGAADALDADAKRMVELLTRAFLAEALLCDEAKGAALSELQKRLQDHGLAPAEVDAFVVGLEAGIQETAELLSVSLPERVPHAELLERARHQIGELGLDAVLDLAAQRRRNEELEGAVRSLESRATTDGLTGLANRAAFDAFLDAQVRERTGRDAPRALGLLMIDVDHFKRVNDQHGHPVGDEVLRMVAGVLNRMTRRGDLAARYGGEEFAVVVPQTSTYGLRTIAERLREAVERERVPLEEAELSVTVSIGGACIARFDSPGDAAALVKLADHLLYRAKNAGRNRSELFQRLELPRRS